MFALGIDFLTDVAVMTDTSSRDKAEWPPHPVRVFMALVAAHYESKPLSEDGHAAKTEWSSERQALEWLESQGAPEMSWPEASPRDVVKVYVPVNDTGLPPNPSRIKAAELRGAMGVMPDRRSRQERTFPAMHIEGVAAERYVYLCWPEATPTAEILNALKELSGKVTRIGHSASLAQVWIIEEFKPVRPVHKPISKTRSLRTTPLRVPALGLLDELDECFNEADIEAFFELSETIATSTGTAKTNAKSDFEERFGIPWSRTASAPTRKRPSVGLFAHYVQKADPEPFVADSIFDPDLLVLTKQEGPVLGLESTSALTAALRGYLLQEAEDKPEWFTGHSAPGTPATDAHLALLPLPYVDAEFADGHILGLAICFPRSISASERASSLAGRIFDSLGQDMELELRMGNLGTWTLRREDRAYPPRALRSATWCEPSFVWASVTPVVLDRHPKRDQRTEREKWCAEVAASISESCVRQGLPRPELIDVDKTSWHRGAPRSKPGPGGMPWLPAKEGSSPRQQIHTLVQFPCEVRGPLLLGAGRFRGYGMCKPLGSPGK